MEPNVQANSSMETAECDYVTVKIQDSIVYALYKRGVTIDLAAAKEMGQFRRDFLKGRSYPGLADIRHIKLITKEARKYLEKEATQGPEISGVTAVAVLVGSRLTVVTANFFMKLVKPKIPTKVFMTREQAIKWLRQFVKFYNQNANEKYRSKPT